MKYLSLKTNEKNNKGSVFLKAFFAMCISKKERWEQQKPPCEA